MRRKALLAVVTAALFMAGCAGTNEGSAPQAEGIVVHGDWTLDVYNVDGSFDRTIEFHNEVVKTGLLEIAFALAGGRNVGGWEVALDSDAGEPDGPCGDDTTPIACSAPASTQVAASGPIVMLQLESTLTAERDGSIGNVASFVETCNPASPDCPANMTSWQFSEKSIRQSGEAAGEQFYVTAGQTIQTTVEFSFTSG